MSFVPSQYRLGITAGGQLGKMLAQAAIAWDIPVVVMDDDPACAARQLGMKFLKGNPRFREDLLKLGKEINLLALEIEHVSIEGLFDLQRAGIRIIPDPESLALIQDKGLQKKRLAEKGIPTLPFVLLDHEEEIVEAVQQGRMQLPFVQKTRKLGYDGRGVKRVDSMEDLSDLLAGPSVIEQLCDIEKEISLIVAGNSHGETCVYPPVEMVFHPEANLVSYLLCPARLTASQAEEASRIAIETYHAFNPGGLLAVEMFLDKQGKCWVNEVAPRPHNSGHHTIEACVTSQYEQQLRCLLGLPFGNTGLIKPAAMVNLLGEPGYSGIPRYEGFEEVLKLPEVYVHIYGKQQTRPFRKMGHVTLLGKDIEELTEKVEFVKQKLKVKAWTNHW